MNLSASIAFLLGLSIFGAAYISASKSFSYTSYATESPGASLDMCSSCKATYAHRDVRCDVCAIVVCFIPSPHRFAHISPQLHTMTLPTIQLHGQLSKLSAASELRQAVLYIFRHLPIPSFYSLLFFKSCIPTQQRPRLDFKGLRFLKVLLKQCIVV